MLHGITFVDRKNMTKAEEEMMRQLTAACDAASVVGNPLLRAKSHIPGKEGWSMEVVIGEKIIGEGRNSRRGAAGEAALASALETVTGRAVPPGYAAHAGAMRRASEAGAKETSSGRFSIISTNNMSTSEKELMEQLLALAKDLPEAPQLRAKKHGRGDDGWTMEVVAGTTVLSTARGKRRSFAGKVALTRAIETLQVRTQTGGSLLTSLSSAPHGAGMAQGRRAGTTGASSSAAAASPAPAPKTNYVSAAVGVVSARRPPAAAAHGMTEDDLALIADLKLACEMVGVQSDPLIRTRKDVVWGKETWTVEVIVGGSTDQHGPSPLLKEEAKESTLAAARTTVFKKALEFIPTIAPLSPLGGLDLSNDEHVVRAVNMSPEAQELLKKLREICTALEIGGTPYVRSVPGKTDPFQMEVYSGDQLLAKGEPTSKWASAAESALHQALDAAQTDGWAGDAGRGTLHGITTVETKNMTKQEEELMRQLKANCAYDESLANPQLRAKNHNPGKEGWTMEVVVGGRVVGEGQNPRRGAAGEAALSMACETVLKKGTAMKKAAAKPKGEELQWELYFHQTPEEGALLERVRAVWVKNGGKGPVHLIATGFHADGSWTMQVRATTMIVAQARQLHRLAAGMEALNAAGQYISSTGRVGTAPPPLVMTTPSAQPPALAAAAIQPHGAVAAVVGAAAVLGAKSAQALHGITVVESKNMSKREEDLMAQVYSKCSRAGVPQLRAKSHVPGKQGWTMEVCVGNQVIGAGRNARRGVAGEEALEKALAALGGGGANALQGAARAAAAAAAGTGSGVSTVNMTSTEKIRMDQLEALCAKHGLMKTGHIPRMQAKRATVHGESLWNVEVMLGNQAIGNAQSVRRGTAGESALEQGIVKVTAHFNGRVAGIDAGVAVASPSRDLSLTFDPSTAADRVQIGGVRVCDSEICNETNGLEQDVDNPDFVYCQKCWTEFATGAVAVVATPMVASPVAVAAPKPAVSASVSPDVLPRMPTLDAASPIQSLQAQLSPSAVTAPVTAAEPAMGMWPDDATSGIAALDQQDSQFFQSAAPWNAAADISRQWGTKSAAPIGLAELGGDAQVVPPSWATGGVLDTSGGGWDLEPQQQQLGGGQWDSTDEELRQEQIVDAQIIAKMQAAQQQALSAQQSAQQAAQQQAQQQVLSAQQSAQQQQQQQQQLFQQQRPDSGQFGMQTAMSFSNAPQHPPMALRQQQSVGQQQRMAGGQSAQQLQQLPHQSLQQQRMQQQPPMGQQQQQEQLLQAQLAQRLQNQLSQNQPLGPTGRQPVPPPQQQQYGYSSQQQSVPPSSWAVSTAQQQVSQQVSQQPQGMWRRQQQQQQQQQHMPLQQGRGAADMPAWDAGASSSFGSGNSWGAPAPTQAPMQDQASGVPWSNNSAMHDSPGSGGGVDSWSTGGADAAAGLDQAHIQHRNPAPLAWMQDQGNAPW